MQISTLVGRFVIALIVFSFVAAILTPTPDVVSQIALMIMMGVVLGVLALIISRFKSFGQTPQSIRRLIIALVCLLSITTAYSVMNMLNRAHRSADSLVVSSVPPPASYAAFSMGNLWIGYASNRSDALSEEIEYVTCSVGIPKTSRFNGSTWMFTFSNKEGFLSTGFGSEVDETVWMDEQHNVTHLGPVLSKNDVSLLWNHRHDENLKITYPTELLAFVKKLKAEQAASTAPPEAAN